MKKIRLTDYPSEYFNVIDKDDEGCFVFGEIIRTSDSCVLISTEYYGPVWFPEDCIKGD
jgi:hypothetical protein